MTGEEHYAEAERLLEKVAELIDKQSTPVAEIVRRLGGGYSEQTIKAAIDVMAARAQVHASLALADFQRRALPPEPVRGMPY